MTPWQAHVQRWTNCTDCALCHQRDRIVLARGTIPCDVLFVGEAPGESENVLGRPFVGPAGKLLDQIIDNALSGLADKPTIALTNLVCCFPLEAKQTGNHEPAPAEIKACRSRLLELIGLCKPKLIVAVGKLAEAHMPAIDVKTVAVTHPAAILRMPHAQKDMAVRRCVVTLTNAVEEIMLPF